MSATSEGASMREVQMREVSASDGASLLHGRTESSSGDARGARSDGNDASGQRIDPDAESPSGCIGALKAEPLLLKTIVGVILGIIVGSIARAANPTPRAVELIGFPGELFMRLLRALIIPLVAISMACGVTSLSRRSRGSARRVAGRLVASYAVTTLVACALGLIIVGIIQPGVGVVIDGARCDGTSSSSGSVPDAAAASRSHVSAVDSLLDTARNFVPDNIVNAASGGNILGVIAASLMFGAALSAVPGETSAPTIALLDSLNAVIEVAVGWAISCMPLGVFSLVAGRVTGSCDPVGTLGALGKYVFAVLLGLAVHGGCVLPCMYSLATRNWGGRMMLGRKETPGWTAVLRRGAPAFVTAFATDSSSASLPVTRRCARTLGVPAALADFALPLGATVNMNGTALYESLTVLFIAQLHGVQLGIGGTLVVALTATIAAVGAAAIPSAGLVTMLIVLQAAGLEEFAGDVGVLAALDWFLDRCRTAVNVEGDLMVVTVVNHWEGNEAEDEEDADGG